MSETGKITAQNKVYKRMNPSVEHLWAEIIDCKNWIDLFEERMQNDPEKAKLIANCKRKLSEVKDAVLPASWRSRKKIFTAWRLLHRISEEMILLMMPEELAAKGQKLIHDFKMSSLPDNLKTDWIVKLEERLKRLEGSSQLSDQDIRNISQFFKTAMNLINDHVDDRFWDIWSKKMLALVYTVLLIVGIALLLPVFSSTPTTPSASTFYISHIMLLGAIGGLVSGIISGEQEYLAKGHFWIATLYYSLIRPAFGALAAILMFWMLQSEYLIKIEPPLQDTIPSATSAPNAQPGQKSQNIQSNGTGSAAAEGEDTSKDQKDQNTTKGSDGKVDPFIVLRAAEGKQIYLYLIVLVLAGFSGDKLLKAVSDRVMTRLFARAEKTKEEK